MATRVQRDIASADAAFGAAVSDLAALLERAGATRPYDDARAYVEGLQHDGWRYRPREHAPSRPPMGSHIPASEHAGWQEWRKRAHADLARAQAEVEAREAGRTVATATEGEPA